MSNQKSSNDPDWLSPQQQNVAELFRSFGIEPIIIDPNDSKSVDKGIEEISDRIQGVAKSKNEDNE